jgi:serpin B
MFTTEPRPVTRRRLLQASAAATALVAAHPAWLVTVRAQESTQADLVAGNTSFALNLYDNLRQSAEGNLLVSPLSISLALAMTYTGADGDTADQMAETLGFDLAPDAIGAAFRDLVDDLVTRGTAEDDPDEDVSARALNIANALWGEQTYPFSEDFMGSLEDDFGAGLQLVDFQNKPEQARDDINDWVEDNTEGRIEDIVPEGVINPDTRLVLANAIWFYGAWANPFEPDNTEDGDFTLLDGDAVTVPFMHQNKFMPYTEGDNYQAVELPYAGSGFTFTVILPDEGEFETVEESLDTGVLDELVSSDVRLAMPKFSFEFDTSLADSLMALGMTDAFDGNIADFSGMIADPDADPLVISDVIHKAFIAVDEEGTEAAAATVVMMESATAAESEPIDVTIDRPFIFAIRDTETGTLLFLGRVLDPSS